VIFLDEDLFWVNEPTHNSERPTHAFQSLYPHSGVQTLDIAPGFGIQDGKVVNLVVRDTVSAAALRTLYANEIARANRFTDVAKGDVETVLALMQDNVERCEPFLAEYEGDYRFLVYFRNSSLGIAIEKRGRAIRLTVDNNTSDANARYDLVYRTRLPYLKWSFTVPYGDEILFVGSGGTFHYADREQIRRNLHRELKVMLTRQATPPTERRRRDGRWVGRTKEFVKRLLGRGTEDLYDLERWTLFNA
jgi:hypothetical protein